MSARKYHRIQHCFVSSMQVATEHMDSIEQFMMIFGDGEKYTFSGSGTLENMSSMIKAIIDNSTSDMDVVDYSHFILELNAFMRAVMEERYCSDSELEEKK